MNDIYNGIYTCRKLTYEQLDILTDALFNKISDKYNPDLIIHPGIRTRYLVDRARDYFGIQPIIIDTARNFPFKKIMRKIFYDSIDLLPDNLANYLTDFYIKVVHATNKKPNIVSMSEQIPKNCSKVLIIDDVFCSGATMQAISHDLNTRGNYNIACATLIWIPNNAHSPDYYALKGKYSLPWRNIGV